MADPNDAQKASFDSQATLMEKRKNRWTLDHTLKTQSVYSLTHTYPLKAVFLSRMDETLREGGLSLTPKNNKWNVIRPFLCLGMPRFHCGSQVFLAVSHGQDGLRKQFISWSLLKERPKAGEPPAWDEMAMEGHPPYVSRSLILLGAHWMWGISDWFSGNPRSRHWMGPQAERVPPLFKQYASKQEYLFWYFDLSANRFDGSWEQMLNLI